MATNNKSKPSKRFETRYGVTLRKKIDAIESELKKKHICPYCGFDKVKRLSTGIWTCTKCNAKFTGRAYTPSKVVQESEVEDG